MGRARGEVGARVAARHPLWAVAPQHRAGDWLCPSISLLFSLSYHVRHQLRAIAPQHRGAIDAGKALLLSQSSSFIPWQLG